MLRLRFVLTLLVAVLIIAGCSTTKTNDYEENVRAFIDQFEKNLAASDAVIMQQFKLQPTDGNITEEGILKAIRIMQNREQDTDSMVCAVNFTGAMISQEAATVRVELVAEFKSLDPVYPLTKDSRFVLWLTSSDGTLTITKIDATGFYNDYREAVRTLSNQKNHERVLASLQLHLQQAHKLQETYDTVAWFTHYNDSIYYYVANGNFTNYFVEYEAKHPHNFTMGLVSETGRVIVPPSFDLVGTIGFTKEDVIEVKKDGLVGHYNLEGKELIPAQYDFIIPFEADNVYALVKRDTLNSWFDASFAYHAGFPSKEAEKYIREFGYLSTATLISKDVNTITKILHPDHVGHGMVMPASYWVTTGILREIQSEINLGEEAAGTESEYYGTEYIKTQGSIFERISENLSALFVMIEGSYLGGREDFYRYKTLTFVDNAGGVVGRDNLYSGENTLKRLDSTLLELKTTVTATEAEEYWDMGDEPGDWNPPQFKYFRISAETNKVLALESNRRFACTEFVKMDSSYLTGEFVYWDSTQRTTVTRDFASNETIIEMRNEILAAYGYSFTDPKVIEQFKYSKWYIARHEQYEDFWDELTEIDKHNLEFLESMIGTLRTNPA